MRDLGVAWEDAPRLVRGLDYYTRTTFEFVHDGLGAQSGIGGGGRYDGLSEALGGPSLPGIGWALGVDRTLLALEAEGVEPPRATARWRSSRCRSVTRRGAGCSCSSPSCAARASPPTWPTATAGSRAR